MTGDAARVDLDRVHGLLSEESYWAAGRSRDHRSGFAELAGAHRFMEIDQRPTRAARLGPA